MESNLASLSETQQTAQRVRCRYSHTTNRQRLETPVVETGKSWKMLRRIVTP